MLARFNLATGAEALLDLEVHHDHKAYLLELYYARMYLSLENMSISR